MGWFGKSRHEKQVEAALKVWGNLFEKTTRGGADAPPVLNFRRPDSRYRYAMFSLSTIQVACAPYMGNPDAVLNELSQNIVQLAVYGKGKEQLIEDGVSPQMTANLGSELLGDFLHQWSAWLDVAPTNREAGINIVAGMLLSTETSEPATDADALRLRPLAEWIVDRVRDMGEAFAEMV
jgi:hypothetical protein